MSFAHNVQRYDAGRLGSAERTGSGGVRVPARIGRTGVQIYRNVDGSERREYRPPEEVFSADSLSTLASAPVTRLHPPVLVTTDNWKDYAIGDVSEKQPERQRVDSNEFIEAPLVINHGPAIAEIQDGNLCEVSAGYTCELDETPGVTPNGERYDAIQRNIKYNHAALGPQGFARAGREARLRTDGNQDTTTEKTKMKVTLDGIEYEKGSDSHVSALETKMTSEKARADKAEKELGETKATLAKRDGELRSARALCEGEEFAKRVDSELNFREDARKVLGADYDFAGKSRRQVMCDAVEKADLGVEVKEDHSDEYVAGLFTGALKASRSDESETDEDDAIDYNRVTKDGKESHEDGEIVSDEEWRKRLDSLYTDSFKK